MKKLIICLLAVVISAQIQSRTFDEIIKNFSKVENVEKVNIGKFGWNFLKMASVGNEDLSMMKKINSVQIIDLSKCSPDIKSRFAREVEALDKDKYELMLMVKDDKDDVLIFSKTEKNKIRELILVITDEPVIVRLKGKFDLNDISACTSFNL